MKTPQIPRIDESRSASGTYGRHDNIDGNDLARHGPEDGARRGNEGNGMASLRLARFILRKPGPAAKAPASATNKPAPRTKSKWEGKNPLTMGTKRTAPPTPPSAARIPMKKVMTSNPSGQTHQAVALASTAAAES